MVKFFWFSCLQVAFQSMKFQSTTSMKGALQTPRDAATYNNSFVMIEKIEKSSMEITPQLRAEIRDVRESRHANLVDFIGVCVDAPNISVLTLFSSKGQLDNILANPDIKLDMAFKESILKDIAQGMNFLHSSHVGVHGRLKTENCVVDSRWTVKVGGFGLASLRQHQEIDVEKQMDPDGMAFSLFWTAPELLGDGIRCLHDLGAGTMAGTARVCVHTRVRYFAESTYSSKRISKLKYLTKVRHTYVLCLWLSTVQVCSCYCVQKRVREIHSLLLLFHAFRHTN